MLLASEDIKQTQNERTCVESELRSCVKVEVAVLGSPSLMSLVVSVDVKQHLNVCWASFRDERTMCGLE